MRGADNRTNQHFEEDRLGKGCVQMLLSSHPIVSLALPQLWATCYLGLVSLQFLSFTTQTFLIQVLPQKRKIQVKERDVLIFFSFVCFYQVIHHWGKASHKIFKDELTKCLLQ